MESKDVYGREWRAIAQEKWVNIRDKPGLQFIKEVPFVPETRFTRLPASNVTDIDIKGNRWGGSTDRAFVFFFYFRSSVVSNSR